MENIFGKEVLSIEPKEDFDHFAEVKKFLADFRLKADDDIEQRDPDFYTPTGDTMFLGLTGSKYLQKNDIGIEGSGNVEISGDRGVVYIDTLYQLVQALNLFLGVELKNYNMFKQIKVSTYEH